MGTNAHDVLRAARVVGSLDEALAGAGLVVGTTARPRHRAPTRTPSEAAAAIVEAARTTEVASSGEPNVAYSAHGISSPPESTTM